MKKLLITLILAAGLLAFPARDAQADYWRQTASLSPAKYMVVYEIPRATAGMNNFLGTWDYETLQASWLNGFNSIGASWRFTVLKGGDLVSIGLADWLNAGDKTSEGAKPVLFVKRQDPLGGDFWIQIDLPCVWTKGDKAAKWHKWPGTDGKVRLTWSDTENTSWWERGNTLE